jgi:O-glycosyl hydrolase
MEGKIDDLKKTVPYFVKILNSQIPYIKQAQKLSPHPLKLFGNPWLAPDWVKTNITLNQLKGEVGGEYYQIWAHYFVKYEQFF